MEVLTKSETEAIINDNQDYTLLNMVRAFIYTITMVSDILTFLPG
jgi:hypothetical protein